jgi:CHASE3 domain sensor protein
MQSTNLTALGRDARVNRFILTLLTIGFAALLAGLAAALWTQKRNTDSERWVAHTLEVQARIGAFASKTERMETARRGRLLSDDPAFNQLFDTALASALADLDSVERKTADNPDQAANIRHMRRLLTDYVTAEKLERSRGKSAQAALRTDFFHDPVVMHIREIRQVADAMSDEERTLLRQREAVQTQTLRTFNLVLVGIALLILTVATATILLVRRTLRELRGSRLELSALNADLEKLVDRAPPNCNAPMPKSSALPISSATTCALPWSTSWASPPNWRRRPRSSPARSTIRPSRAARFPRQWTCAARLRKTCPKRSASSAAPRRRWTA